MKTIIQLQKDWTNGTTAYKAGTMLEAEDSQVQHLINDGTASVVDTQKMQNDGKGIAVREFNESDTEKITVAVEEAVNKALAKNKIKPQSIIDPQPERNSYQKNAEYDSFGEFLKDVAFAEKYNGMPAKLAKWTNHVKATGMSESVGADGGFLVPEEFRTQLLMDALEQTVFQSRCQSIPIGSNSVKIPTVNVSSHASSTYGGIALYRPAEGGTKTGSKPAFGQVTLELKKLIGLCYVTDELLEDSPITVGPLISRMFTEAIRFQVDDDIINGTGAGMPLGILNASGTVSQAKLTGQEAASIKFSNITSMYSRLKPRSLANAIWAAHPSAFPQLASLALNVGTGGSAVGLVQNISQPPYLSILGRPLYLTEHCQTLGKAGDIILGDFSQYLFAQKGGVKYDVSLHVQFVSDETAYRFVMRYDGQPWEQSALTPKHGSTTLGSFVILETRS